MKLLLISAVLTCFQIFAFSRIITFKRRNEITCVVTGKKSFNTPIYLNPPLENATLSRKIVGSQNIGHNFNNNTDWTTKNPTDFFYGATIDKRWQDFKIIKKQNIIFENFSHMVAFSVYSPKVLKFVLYRGNKIMNDEFTTENKTLEKTLNQWQHYVLRIQNKTIIISLENKMIWKKKLLETPNKTRIINQNSTTYWKKHKYSFYWSKTRDSVNTYSSLIFNTSGIHSELCLSMFVLLEKNCFLELKLNSVINKNVTYRSSESDWRKWQNIRIRFNPAGKTSNMTIFKGQSDNINKANGSWAFQIYDISPCSSEEFESYHATIINNSETYLCEELNSKKNIKYSNMTTIQHDFLRHICRNTLGENFKNCEHHQIYNQDRKPNCAWGYQPPKCIEVCSKGFYGFNCKKSCPNNCGNDCDHIYGFCFFLNSKKITNVSITVDFIKPDEYNMSYNLWYKKENKKFCESKPAESSKKDIKEISKESYRIENLDPFSNYTLSLDVDGRYEISKSVVTKSNVHIAKEELPKHLSFDKNNHLQMGFQCENMNGGLNLSVSLTCLSEWCVNETITSKNDISVNKTTFQEKILIDIQGVRYFTKYEPRVTARRLKQMHQKIYKEIMAESGGSLPVQNLTFNATSNALFLKWKPPYPPTGNISHYTLVIVGKTIKDKLEYNISHDNSEFISKNVSKLQDNKKYNITVRAINHNVEEKYSNNSTITGRTKQKIPMVPSDLGITYNRTSHTFNLVWEHVIYVNSPLNLFVIQLQSLNASRIYNFTIPNNQILGKYYFEIELLNFTIYNISVSGRNKFDGDKATIQARVFPAIANHTYPLIETCRNSVCILSAPNPNISTFFNLSLYSQSKNCDQVNTTIEEMAKYSKFDLKQNTEIWISSQDKTYCVLQTDFLDNNSRGKINIIVLIVTLVTFTVLMSCFLICTYIFKIFPFDAQKQTPLRNKSRSGSSMQLSRITRTRPKISDPEEEIQLTATEDMSSFDSRPITVEELEGYLKKCFEKGPEDSELSRQYNQVPKIAKNLSSKMARLARNKKKNRYDNLLPYDSTRVVLKVSGTESNYINANYIDGYEIPKAFIATQAPTQLTIPDFWLMVWQQNVSTIVMITELCENGVNKCEKYWPEESHRYGNILVKLLNEKTNPNYIERHMEAIYKHETRSINHLQFTSWPDHGTPLYPQSVVPLMRKLLATPQKNPIIVHCNAGCGRTGTVILCDIILRMAAKEKTVDFLKILKNIRLQRSHLVNSFEQYLFAHLLVLECLNGKDFSIPVTENFEDDVNKVLRKSTVKPVMDELDKVVEFCEKFQFKVKLMLSDKDKLKNRFSNILPGHTRVFLGSGYINAIYVDCYMAPKKFIVTQQPLDNTLEDFWRLVLDQGVSTIISLNDIDGNDSNCPIFWPQEHNIFLKTIKLQLLNVLDKNRYCLIKVKVDLIDGSDTKIVHIVDLKTWKRETPKPVVFTDLIDVWNEMVSTSRNGNSKIVVTCYDGCTASGLFTALAFMLEKLNSEHVCDVFTAIRVVRQSRFQFVQDNAQVELLYKIAVEYIKTFENYKNFKK